MMVQVEAPTPKSIKKSDPVVFPQTHLDVVEVHLHQVGVVPLHPQQGLFYVSGVGLFIWDCFILGALDHTYNTGHTAVDQTSLTVGTTHI